MAMTSVVRAEAASRRWWWRDVGEGGDGGGNDDGCNGARDCAHHARRAGTQTTQLDRSGGRARDMEFRTRAREASQRGRHRRVALAGAHLFADEMWKKKMMLPKSPGANTRRAPAARSRRGTRACSSIED